MTDFTWGIPAVAAVFFSILMVALIVFQVALIAGAPLGHLAWGGRDRVLPRRKRLGSGTSILLYVAFTVIVLQRAELIAVLPWSTFPYVATWVLVGYFILGIGLNGLSRSRAEKWTMAPLCAVLAALTTLIALS